MFVMRRLVFVFILLFLAVCFHEAAAQEFDSPVVEVIREYKSMRGVRKFVAGGGKLNIARGLLRKTPVAPVADDVTELSVLKMQNASEEVRTSFENDLRSALKSYTYVGIQDSPVGEVEVYVMFSSSHEIDEMVIYNAAIFSLNCLHGPFAPEALHALANRKLEI